MDRETQTNVIDIIPVNGMLLISLAEKYKDHPDAVICGGRGPMTAIVSYVRNKTPAEMDAAKQEKIKINSAIYAEISQLEEQIKILQKTIVKV